jgi:hypothetical protein
VIFGRGSVRLSRRSSSSGELAPEAASLGEVGGPIRVDSPILTYVESHSGVGRAAALGKVLDKSEAFIFVVGGGRVESGSVDGGNWCPSAPPSSPMGDEFARSVLESTVVSRCIRKTLALIKGNSMACEVAAVVEGRRRCKI